MTKSPIRSLHGSVMVRIEITGFVLDVTSVPLPIATNAKERNGHFQVCIRFNSHKRHWNRIAVLVVWFVAPNRCHGQALFSKGQFRRNEKLHFISKLHFRQSFVESSIESIIPLFTNLNGSSLLHMSSVNELGTFGNARAKPSFLRLLGDDMANQMDLNNIAMLSWSNKFFQLVSTRTVVERCQL